MKAAHVIFPPRTRSATWRESFEAVLIGEHTVVIWRYAGEQREAHVATLEGREELETLARKILRRTAIARRRDERKRELRVVGGRRS